jgi:predicted PurR-regulated permease PerM
LPEYLPENFLLAPQVVNFLTATAANSVILASGIAGALTNTLLIFIISFYLLISRREISQFILKIIPDEYEDDYLFLEKTLNQTFGSFLQVQVFLGLVLGIITFAVLVILQINFALSSALVAAVLAMVPVIGPILFLLPVILAGLTVSLQKMIIAVVVIALAAQLVYNFLAPKLLGSALKIHPLIVLLSFLLGYRLTGVWGAIFAVPIVSAVAIIGQELLKYWKQEADK